jgi:hypothetical protein
MAVIEAIQTTYLEAFGAEASYIIFDDIPSTYEHLEIRINAQTNRATYGNDAIEIRLGDTGHSPVDTGSNYSYHIMETDTSTTTNGQAYTGVNNPRIGRISSGVAGAANFGTCIISILDYSNANKNTTVTGLGGMTSGLGTTANDTKVTFNTVLWADTSVVNAIQLMLSDGTGWNRGSEFTLYGLNSS